MNNRRNCKHDDKLCIHASWRYFARVGIFQREVYFSSSSFLDKCFLWHKSNLYKNAQNGVMRRIRSPSETGLNSIIVDSQNIRKFLCVTGISTVDDVYLPLKCWCIHSTFAVYTTWPNFAFLEQTTNLRQPTEYRLAICVESYNLIVDRRSGNDSPIYRCVILSWFDRPDRMLFEKWLIEFHSSLSVEFCANALFIFIHQYL
jgi:hypothetical protein